jgi:hypothetical protein
MKERLLHILHFFLKTMEVAIALLLVCCPLLLYAIVWSQPGSGWQDATAYQKLVVLVVIGGAPVFCGLVWLKLIWRRHRQLAEYDPPGKEEQK